jgi:hypothetical protein
MGEDVKEKNLIGHIGTSQYMYPVSEWKKRAININGINDYGDCHMKNCVFISALDTWRLFGISNRYFLFDDD